MKIDGKQIVIHHPSFDIRQIPEEDRLNVAVEILRKYAPAESDYMGIVYKSECKENPENFKEFCKVMGIEHILIEL